MMDQLNYFLSNGLWSIVEALFNYPSQFIKEEKVSVEKWLLDIATHPNQSRFTSPTFQHPWQLSWLTASLILKLITSNSPEIRNMKWFTEQRISRSDLEKLKKVSELHGLMCNLPEEISVELKNELVQLYIRIISFDFVKSHSSGSSIPPVKELSSDAVAYLKRCLLKDPLSTNSVIQRVLCLWSAHFVQSDNVLQDIYEEALRIFILNVKEGKIEYSSKLLCLLTIFEVSEDKEKKIIEHIFPRILKLCNEEKIPFSNVYLSLIGRGKCSLLRALVDMEEGEKMWKNTADENPSFQNKLLKSFITNDGNINLREIFLRAYKRNVPWIDDVVTTCSQAVILQNIEAVRACLNVSGLQELWPLVYFDLWKQFLEYGRSNINLKAVIEECKNVIEDQSVLLKISQMEQCLIFSEWIINSGTAKTDSLSSVVEQVINSCCALHALKRTGKLSGLEEEAVIEALKRFRLGSGNSSKSLLQTEICIFTGYFLVMKVYKAIISSMDLGSTARNVDTLEYEENVKKKLNEVKHSLSKLYPLTFRVEILEYIFSLLFLQHKDLHDENTSDSGGEDSDIGMEEKQSADSKQEGRPQLIRSSSVLSDSSKEKLLFKETQAPVSSSSMSKKRLPSIESRKNLESTTEENKRASTASCCSGSESYGKMHKRQPGPGLYVCGSQVVNDLLQCLKDCLVDASVALFSSLAEVGEEGGGKIDEVYHRVPSTILEDSVQKRMARLSHYVGEAACRLEIVTSERSTSPNISKSYLHPFWHDLPGRVGKPVRAFVTGDPSDDSEEEHGSVMTSKTSYLRKRKSSTFMSSSPVMTELKSGTKRISCSEAEKSSESGSQSNSNGGFISEGGRRRIRRSTRSRRHSNKSARLSERMLCGFCHPSRGPTLLPSFGIIDRMLASPKSLVIQCFSQGEIMKAKKVIEIFKLEDTPLAYEAKYLEEYVSLLHKLDKKTKEHKLSRAPFSSKQWSSTLQCVKRAATAGMQSTSLSNIVESFLTTVKPPTIEGLETVVKDYPQASAYLSEIIPDESYSGHTEGYVAAILTDLALTYPGTSEQSMNLLEIALKHCPKKPQLSNDDGLSLNQGRSSPYGRGGKFQATYSPNVPSQPPGPVGFATFLQNAMGSLKILNEHLQIENGPLSLIHFPLFPKGKKLSMPELIATLLPLNPFSIASCLSFWEELFGTVRGFKDIMFFNVSSKVDSVSSFQTNDEGQKKKVTVKELNVSSINGAFNAIINACCSLPWQAEVIYKSDHSRKTSSNEEVQYLQMLFCYLKTMSTVMIQSNLQRKGFQVPSCYFDVLNERLDSIIGKLLFESDVNPSRLETVAGKMNLDLISCIIRNCCPPIKSSMPALECATQLQRGLVEKKWGKVILNPVSKNWNGPSRPPAKLVQKLLTELLKFLREESKNQHLLLRDEIESASQHQGIYDLLVEGTQELANVSMDLLPAADDSKSFFANLCNLATLHAIIFLEINGSKQKEDDDIRCYGLTSCNPSEQLLSRMSICYKVGSLGYISIHDMCQLCLGMELSVAICNPSSSKDSSIGSYKANQFPFCTFPLHPSLVPSSLKLPSPDPRLLFVISTGCAWCAKVAVLSHKMDIDSQLESLINDYLTFSVRLDSVNPFTSIQLPCLVQLYCQHIYSSPSLDCCASFSADTSSMNSTATSSHDGEPSLGGKFCNQGGLLSDDCVQGIIDFLTKYSKGQLKDDITDLSAKFSPGNLQDLPLKIIVPDCSVCIILDNQKRSEGGAIEGYDEDSNLTINSKPEVAEWSWKGGELPSAVLEYLELRCWPISTIAVLVNNSESSIFLPPIMSHATCLKQLLQVLLYYPSTQDKADGIVALLSPEGLPCDRLWPIMNDVLFSVDQITTQDMLGYLKMIPQPRLFEEPKLTILHDIMMWEISSRGPDKDVEEPWKYCMQIRDPLVRVASVLCNINRWSSIKEDVSREALLLLCGDKEVNIFIPEHTKEILLDKLHKVEIYQQIFAHVKSPAVSNWFDVSCLSENDPIAVLQSLIQVKQVTLFLKWMEIHSLDEDIMCMTNHAFVLMLTSNPPDFTSAKKMLEYVPIKNAAQIIKGSLPLLNSIPTLKFAISFLLENCKSTLSSEECVVYEQWAIGLVMVSHRLLLGKSNPRKQKHSIYGKLWSWLDLASSPLLILEQLIMNVQLEALDAVLAILKPHLLPGSSKVIPGESRKLTVGEVDRLLRQYAAKALEFRVCSGSVGREEAYFPHLKAPSPSFKMSASASSLSLSGTGKGDKLLESLSSGSVQSIDLEFIMPAKAPGKAEWVPNDEVTFCMCCKLVSFSMFNRRHHCRRCGRVICGACSTRRLKVEGYGDLPVRVCDNCLNQSQANLESDEDDHEEAEEVDEEDPDERLGNNGWWWRLTGDKAQDATVREEFSFEQSPSVSLCLAILKHHSPGDPAHPRLLLDSAENLLSLLRPSSDASKSLNPEVDHALVIHMVRSLSVASKVLYSRIGVGAGVERCDKVIGRAGLLNLLVRSGWAEAGVWAGALLEPNIGTPAAILEDSRSGRSGSVSKRRHHGLTSLRDRLVQEEQWELALEVATKGGLGRAGIWAAWGKACLRVGGWSRARLLFARCLQKGGGSIEGPPAGALATASSSHLSEIIKILEEHNVALPLLLEDPPSYSSHPYPSVLHSLVSLDAISKGIILLPPAPSQERPVGSGPPLQEDVKEECLFYLKTYGTDQMVVDFLLRHGEIKAALLYFLNAHMSPEIFLDEIYLRCLKMGWVTELEAEMKAVDPTLERWKPHLCCLCRLLERRGMLHILYTAQVFSEDHVRAAMTCIRFYCNDINSYSKMRQNCIHLNNAQKHMEAELATVGWVAEVPAPQPLTSAHSKIPSFGRKTSDGSVKRTNSESSILPLKLDPKDLDKHINTIRRQDEVAKFLGNCEAAGTPVVKLAIKLAEKSNKLKTLPTLFGSTWERVHLAVLAIICGKDVEEGFGVAFRIIQDYHLKAVGVFELAGKMLVGDGRPKDLIHLISCIQSSGISDCSSVCDQVAYSCIQSLVKSWETGWDIAKSAEEEDDTSFENGSVKSSLTPLVDPLLKIITDPEIKISACIACGQLKNAYLIAVRINSNSDVERIADAAERSGQSAIYRICQRRLELARTAPGVKY